MRVWCEWARGAVGGTATSLYNMMQFLTGNDHWSRWFEYPWVLMNGDFRIGQKVLDAAGGTAPLQHLIANIGAAVTNVDCDPEVGRQPTKNIVFELGDIRSLPHPDGSFDRVVCVSAIEHMDRPEQAVRELWRVVKPGGRLLLTMDVANYERHNHTVDEKKATGILGSFGVPLPPTPPDVLRRTLRELDQREGEPGNVELRVLCLRCDKEEGE